MRSPTVLGYRDVPAAAKGSRPVISSRRATRTAKHSEFEPRVRARAARRSTTPKFCLLGRDRANFVQYRQPCRHDQTNPSVGFWPSYAVCRIRARAKSIHGKFRGRCECARGQGDASKQLRRLDRTSQLMSSQPKRGSSRRDTTKRRRKPASGRKHRKAASFVASCILDARVREHDT